MHKTFGSVGVSGHSLTQSARCVYAANIQTHNHSLPLRARVSGEMHRWRR